MADLKLTNVAKTYGGSVEVLKNINLDIKQGELIVFVGPSGCGKSTLLRMIAGLERISGGELQIDGQVVNDVPPSERGIAMVFQSYALYPHMTVRDNMAFALRIAKKSEPEIKQAVEAAAAKLQLTDYLDRLPKALSGGQRQRVAIGRAIVRDPKVYLFDEPLSNLDAALRVATRIEIAQLKEAMPDSTMIYVTHDQVEAMTLANKIVVLNKGRIEQVGHPLDLYNKPATQFVAGFIGSPQMNFFGGDFAAQHGAATVGLRPEHLKVDASGLIRGTLLHAEKLGNETFAYVAAGDMGELTARVDGTLALNPGDTLTLGFAQERLYRFDARGLSI
jgi:multiple sugar transport system ATP-binding protein